MTTLLDDAFAHHIWASLLLIDACSELSDEQLDTSLPGTYGSILETMRHIVVSDTGYLNRLSDGRHPRIEEADMGLSELRSVMAANREAWTEILDDAPDPREMVTVRRDDGSTFSAPKGIRLAQVVHHGTDHRSQVCTALTSLGIEPPFIDVWDYGREMGLTHEATSST